jgi:alpha-L-fucosidase
MHWGLYSLLRNNEWAMHLSRIPHEEYFKQMARFNPSRFNADEWADLMLESGTRFLLITTKHHDGFCLWDTDLTDKKVTNTPFQRDIIAELAPALQERGIMLHFYYSLMDWTHPAYRNDWPEYLNYLYGQLDELLTRYGKVNGVLFDGYWPAYAFSDDDAYFKEGGPYDLARVYDRIHELQPDAVVTNNHHVTPLKGEDYQVWELDLPGENTIGWNPTEIGPLPTATWWNLNGGWGYHPGVHNVKSVDTILGTMRKVHKAGATFFLNVGPRPYGDIHPEEQMALRQIGRKARDLCLL